MFLFMCLLTVVNANLSIHFDPFLTLRVLDCWPSLIFLMFLSLFTLPFDNSITLSLYLLVNCRLWDTIITKCLDEYDFSTSITPMEFSLSSAPVGSSHSNICGSLMIDLAKATLCFSPPDNKEAFLYNSSSLMLICFNNSSALVFPSFTFLPLISKGNITLNNTVSSSKRLYC